MEGAKLPSLEVDDDIYMQVALLSRAWNVSKGGVIRRLLSEFSKVEESSVSPIAGKVPIHAIYAGIRTDGLFDTTTKSVTVTTGALADRTFKSPSGAAVALVAQLSPDVHPNRNGWYFWVQSKNGELLEKIRYQ